MDLLQKLTVLADAAKYDAACTSSGVDRAARPGGIGAVTSTILASHVVEAAEAQTEEQ